MTEIYFKKALEVMVDSGEVTTYVDLLDAINKAEKKALADCRREAKTLRKNCHRLLSSQALPVREADTVAELINMNEIIDGAEGKAAE